MKRAAAFALAACGLYAQDYHPAPPMTGTVRIMGNSHMDKLVENWEQSFHRFHPGVRFEKKYLGTANAIAGLYLETADIALMGRDILPIEDVAYRRVFPSGALDIAVATASFNIPLETFAFAIFVNKNNPIEGLSMAQLASIFECDRAPAVKTWGDLGLKGEWASRPIHRHGYEISSGLGYFFQQRVLRGSHKWNCDFQEYVNEYVPGSDRKLVANAGDLIVKAIDRDPGAIGFAGFGHATPAVKALPLAEDGGPYVPLTRANVANRTYPLTRTVYVFINRQPATPIVAEFLRYVLSKSGQADVARQDVYLPLPAEFAGTQLAKLPH